VMFSLSDVPSGDVGHYVAECAMKVSVSFRRRLSTDGEDDINLSLIHATELPQICVLAKLI